MRSDFSVFHRIDDIESMSAERFFSFAERLMAYEGALRFTAQQQERETPEYERARPNASSGESRSNSANATSGDGKKHYRDIKHNPELAQYFDQGAG